MNSTFDSNKVILDKYIFKGGDISKFSSFIKEQFELHSMNKLSGRIFNPLGFASNIYELSDNPIFDQTIKKLTSDLTGQSGILDTTDGKTFGRVMDNDAFQTQIRDVEEFKSVVEGGSDSFLRSSLRNIVNSFKNKVGQAVPFVEFTGTKSIMAQSLAYTYELFGNNFKGSETTLGNLYDEEFAKEEDYTKIDPIGTQAINYTHSVYSIAMRDPLALRKIINGVNEGLYAQNIAVRKPNSIRNIEERNIRRILKKTGIRLPQKDMEFWVRRTAEYEPNIRGNRKLVSSGTSNIKKPEKDSIYQILLFNRGMVNFDNLYDSFLEDYIDTFGDDGEFIKLEEHRIKEIKNDNENKTPEPPQKIITGQATLFNKRYFKKREEFKRSSEFHNSSLDDIDNPDYDDELIVSDILDVESENDFDHMFMSFEDVRTNKIIFLKPYIDGLTDDTQASYDEGDYLGRTESIPKYRKTTGSLNFSFVLHTSTPKELMMMYKKIEFLESLNYPIANNDFTIVKNPLIRFTLGDLYRNQGGYITSFSKSVIDNESTWELRKGYNVPKMIRCAITIQKLNKRMPYYEKEYNFDRSGNSFKLYGMDYTNL